MRLGRHQINDQRWRRPLALPENQRKCLLEVGTTVEIDTDNARSLGLHFRWLDGSPESYILKWFDTEARRKKLDYGPRRILNANRQSISKSRLAARSEVISALS